MLNERLKPRTPPEQPQNKPRTTPEQPQNGPRTPQNASERWRKRVLVVAWNIWTQELTSTRSSFDPNSCPNSTRCSFCPKKLKKTLISGPRNGTPKTMPECTPPSCPSQLLHIYVCMYVFVHTSTCIHTYIYVCVEHLYIHVGRGTPLTTPSSTYR